LGILLKHFFKIAWFLGFKNPIIYLTLAGWNCLLKNMGFSVDYDLVQLKSREKFN